MGGRYQRLEEIDWWDSDRVRAASCVVAGCGALGNEVVKNLLLIGWGNIFLVDFDVVELTNLTRSPLFTLADLGGPKVEALRSAVRRINPDCTVTPLFGAITSRLSPGLLSRVDVVFGCLDSVRARLELAAMTSLADTIHIDGGISDFQATVKLFRPSLGGPCYGCTLTKADLKALDLRNVCPANDARALAQGSVPTTPVTASIAAAIMVQQAVNSVSAHPEPASFPLGREIRFEAKFNRSWVTELPRARSCRFHPAPETPIEIDVSTAETWGDLIGKCSRRTGKSIRSLEFSPPLWRSSTCLECGNEVEVMTVHNSVSEVNCNICGGATVPNLIKAVTANSGGLALGDAAWELPAWFWFRANGASRSYVFEIQEQGEIIEP